MLLKKYSINFYSTFPYINRNTYEKQNKKYKLILWEVKLLEDASDNLIIRNILSGDNESFRILIDKYGDSILGYTIHQVKDKNTAEEIVQDTFVKAFYNLKSFNINKPFLPWLMTISKHLIIDYFREQKKHYSIDIVDNFQSESLIDPKSPEKITEQHELFTEIEKTLNSIKDKYRTLLILKYFQELSYEEISSVLNISINKVRWQLYQARNIFMREFKKNYINERGNSYAMH